MKKEIIKHSVLFICGFLVLSTGSFAQYLNPEFSKYTFDYNIFTMEEDGEGNVYCGGDFTSVGISCGSGVLFNPDGSFTQSVPNNRINGVVHIIISIPGGGWLIGGVFTSIDGIPRNNLARINDNGTLHPFAPVINGLVRALAFDSEGELYVGGAFTQVNGLTRNRLCKFDAFNELSSFNPNLNNDVHALAVDASDRLYVGGRFTSVGNSPRNRLCRFLNSGALQPFNPSPNNFVNTIVMDDLGNVYVGGVFGTIGGVNRPNVCKFNSSDVVTNFFSNLNGAVTSLAIDNENGVYIGGEFDEVAINLTRNHLCHYDVNGNLSSFNPNIDGTVHALAVDEEGSLFVGGYFENVGGDVRRMRFCKFHSDGTLSPLDVSVNDNNLFQSIINSVAVNSNGQFYIGGNFYMVKTVERLRFCKIGADGELLSFSPTFNDRVASIRISESGEIYCGGDFEMVNNIARKNLCKFDSNSDLSSFSASFNNSSFIQDIALDGAGNVYVGGAFSMVNGESRTRLCKFDSNGNLTDFNPVVSHEIWALTTDTDGNLYVGGDFSFVNGVARRRLCKFDSNGVLQPLSALIWNTVMALEVDANNNLYVGGIFSDVNEIDLDGLCVFDSSGQLTDFNYDFDGGVYELCFDEDGGLYVGGGFANVNGNARGGVCKIENTGELGSFGELVNQAGVYAIVSHSNGSVFVGGTNNLNHFNIYTCNTSIAQSNNPFLCQGESLNVVSHSTLGANGLGTPSGLPLGVEATWNENEIVISGTPTETGSFEYAIPLQGECGDLNAVARGVISIGVAPNTSEASSSPTLCVDTPLPTITHTTSNAYAILYENIAGVNGLPLGVRAVWDDNVLSIIGTPTQTGTFEYSIPVYSECDEVNATGIIVVNGVDASVINADTLLTAVAVDATYQWIDCNSDLEIEGETSASFAPLVSGSYAVTVSSNGCALTSDCENVIIIGVDESLESRELLAFPNPTAGMIQVDLSSQRDVYYFEVKNVLGQVIMSSRVNGENVLMLDIPGDSGTYFIEFFKKDGAKEVVKVSKE